MSEKERLMATLFETTGREHVLIHFTSASTAAVSEETFCAAINRAIATAEKDYGI